MPDSELKPRSFRIDDLTAERFRKIAEETGGNQQQTMAFLIDAYEMQKKREELPEKREDISQMDEYLDVIRLKYISSLADNVHQEEIIRKKLAVHLEKQEEEIEKLKQKIRDAERTKEAMAAELKETAGQLSQARTELQNAQARLADKEKLNQELRESRQKLQESCTFGQLQADSMKKEAEKSAEEERKLREELTALQKAKKECEDQLAQEREKAQMQVQMQAQREEIRLAKALLEQEQAYQAQIHKLKEKHLAEIAGYQQTYRELLDQINQQAALRPEAEKSQKAEDGSGEEPQNSEKQTK